MSTETETTESTESTQATTGTGQQEPDTGTEATETPQQGQEAESGNREAAKYRRQLRDTETERDALAQRVSHMQTHEAQRLAAEQLADGTDLWRDGTTVADLLDDDGNLDPAKVYEVAKELLGAHPHWKRGAPVVSTGPRMMRSGASSGSHTGTSWQGLIHPGGSRD